ncbi:MAG: LacI family DNA-binding transcriptional regulator [Prolixibacteraceae bacterium]|jgi:DNA-binding LacI/PurR family transcriptional regulator|nr:LacI family DNA-binding transcriptional regulator [Prolixibacteraceae bacterium]MBT6998897.1 LacI family DNA-binding transcriptional regulator [Prolixibacteraceae bacterium]
MKKSRTTITEIAKELGISPSTVSRALNNHPAISKKTKRAVVKLAKKLNYQPNLLALNLLNKKTNTIGVIVPEITSYFFSSIINGIQDMVNPLGINMIIGQSNESYEAEKNIVQTFASIRVDGFLISPASETKIFDHFEILVNNNIPLVIFDRDCEGIKIDKVFVDEYKGAFQAVEYLIQTGCKRIAHIAGQQTLSTARHRLKAYKDALKKHKLPIIEEYIVESTGFAPEHGIDPTKKLLALPKPPDAIFTINDGVAIGAMYIIKDAGLKIPDEISVIGFDDDPHSSYFKPSLSTVWQPTYEMGMLSARILMKRINTNNDLSKIRIESLFPELIIRESSIQISE